VVDLPDGVLGGAFGLRPNAAGLGDLRHLFDPAFRRDRLAAAHPKYLTANPATRPAAKRPAVGAWQHRR